nr:MAG TPA: hypothetical protein [Microviridae sp.]
MENWKACFVLSYLASYLVLFVSALLFCFWLVGDIYFVLP